MPQAYGFRDDFNDVSDISYIGKLEIVSLLMLIAILI